MSVEKELKNLKQAFDAVARAIEAEMPEIWGEAQKIWGKDNEQIVQFMIKPNPYFKGLAPVDVGQTEQGRKKICDYLTAVRYGTYL